MRKEVSSYTISRMKAHAKRGLRGKKLQDAVRADVEERFGAAAVDWAAWLEFFKLILPLILALFK